LIIVQLKGGLGNQLFQYAAALSLGALHNTQVKVDVSQLLAPDEEIGTMRNYELKYVNQPPAVASEAEINAMIKEPFLLKYYRKTLPPFKRKIYKEASFRFDIHFFESQNNIYLKGYRQSEKYFAQIAENIKQQLSLQLSVYRSVEAYGEQLKIHNSVSIHIRHGDYTNAAVTEFHGILGMEYYNRAIEEIIQIVDNPVFYIFTDNPEWVKQNFSINHETIFVSGAISQTHYEDLYLMRCCRHNIIANSSFSWWAAWFNKNPEKVVVAPIKWFDKANYDTTDLIPESWKRI
jgi:hypothetical protein